jgi:hypothetical protein
MHADRANCPTNSPGHLLKQRTGSEPPHRMYIQPVFLLCLIGGSLPAEPRRKRKRLPYGTALHRATIPQYWCKRTRSPKLVASSLLFPARTVPKLESIIEAVSWRTNNASTNTQRKQTHINCQRLFVPGGGTHAGVAPRTSLVVEGPVT